LIYAGKKPVDSIYSLLADSLFSRIFQHHSANESKEHVEECAPGSPVLDFWELPSVSALLLKHFQEGIQYFLDISK
jgi:hypothetical protein